MAHFKISVKKGRKGEVLIYGNYYEGNEPIKIARIEVEREWKFGGPTIDSYYVDIVHQPELRSSLYMNLGAYPNLKSVRAKAYYFEVEETTESDKVDWGKAPVSKELVEEVV
jgi:hypothetical protein